MKTQTYEQLLADLDAALAFCQTLGLAQGSVRGRFGDYRARIAQLVAFIEAECNGREVSRIENLTRRRVGERGTHD